MSLIFKESDPYSPTGWIPYSVMEELTPKETPVGIKMPEHKGLVQTIVFNSNARGKKL
jgi:hypothetical protein